MDLATRGLWEDKEGSPRAGSSQVPGTGLLPCLFLPKGRRVRHKVQLWNCLMPHPIMEEVCGWLFKCFSPNFERCRYMRK